jgi:hypothetical protein
MKRFPVQQRDAEDPIEEIAANLRTAEDLFVENAPESSQSLA